MRATHVIACIITLLSLIGCGQNPHGRRIIESPSFFPLERDAASNDIAPGLRPEFRTTRGAEQEFNASMWAEPTLSSLPFYCDPTRFPPNMLLSIADCRPFLQNLEPIFPFEGDGGYPFPFFGRNDFLEDDGPHHRYKPKRRLRKLKKELMHHKKDARSSAD